MDWRFAPGSIKWFNKSGLAIRSNCCVSSDCMKLVKLMHSQPLSNYKLDTAARELLGKSKMSLPVTYFSIGCLSAMTSAKVGKLYRYCLIDAMLSMEVWQHCRLTESVFCTSWYCRSPIEHMLSGSTGRTVESLLVHSLNATGYALLDSTHSIYMRVSGGHVAPVIP
eukprot:EG_transcript_38040